MILVTWVLCGRAVLIISQSWNKPHTFDYVLISSQQEILNDDDDVLEDTLKLKITYLLGQHIKIQSNLVKRTENRTHL